MKTVSVITTVHGGHLNCPLRHSEDKTHRKMPWHNYYKKFVNMGFHISPSASQDTHSENWGTVTAARTAVWGDSVSYDDLMAGSKANRVYASEDDELVGAFQVEYSGSSGSSTAVERYSDSRR